ncbi:hypothetical protein EQ500_05420 [Lactobacillus sp. XV13L]|nr:hypothetical protein [Lactobacillus sp. XV13L]
MSLIKKVIDSDKSVRQISRDTGISAGNISSLRSGNRRIVNLNVKTAYLLSEYAKKIGIK